MLLETLFSAIAEAVFGYLLQESGRKIFRPDLLSLAFQTALARAYMAFARQHPDWTASLFDETFLKSEPVIPLLADLLTRRGQPDPADLARRFAIHLGHRDPDRWERLGDATRAAADLLTGLEAELARQEALQPLYDSRALERIAENSEAIRRALEEGWPKALAEAAKSHRQRPRLRCRRPGCEREHHHHRRSQQNRVAQPRRQWLGPTGPGHRACF